MQIKITIPLKLHLGCGDILLKDWVNIDMTKPRFDIPEGIIFLDSDIRDLSFIPSESVDEILIINVLEHFPMSEHDLLLYNWWRMLKLNGRVRLVGPNFESMTSSYLKGEIFGRNIKTELWDVFQSVLFGIKQMPGHMSLLTPWYLEKLFNRTLFDSKILVQQNGWGIAVEAHKKLDSCGCTTRKINAKIEDDDDEVSGLWPENWEILKL